MKRTYSIALLLALVCGMTGLSSITSAQIYPLSAAGYKAPTRRHDKAKIKESYAKIPLSFVANFGQADKTVKFVSRGSGYSLALAPTSFTLAVASQRNKSNDASLVQATLLGGNAAAKISGFEKLLTTTNYFIGRDPRQWKTNVPNYAKVKYSGVYPGVDLVFYGNQNHLEYDFTVAPGASPDVIAFGFAGITDLRVDDRGDLILRTKAGEVRQTRPVVYQQINGARQIIPASYVVKDKDQVAFQIADYDRSKPLVIDPTLAFSTYLGGNGNDRVNGIAVDASGDIYLVGDTSSTNFPVTPGAFDTTKTVVDTDAFVAKMNAAGTALIYSTYFGGGSNMDSGRDIAVDAAGNAYIAGASDSSDLPTTPGAFRSTPVGSDESDGFAMKLNPTGTALVYSTFLGPIIAGAIAVDSAGNAFITGQANADYPTTPGAFQPTSAGSSEAFVTKLNATGTALIYSTFLGGSGFDSASDIAIDAAGNAYVTGTAQAGFPVTPGAFQTTFGGVNDAFVTKLNATGTALIYSTFVGGSGTEGANGITINEAGNAYITGFTGSSNFPTTAGAFQTSKAAGQDVFVTEVNTSGSALVYSTYLGGDADEFSVRIAVDAAGNATLTGLTGSTNFPVTADAIQSAYAGNNDAFITRLNAAGTGLVFSTYLGGSSSEAGFAITVDGAGNIIVGGQTSSTDFPTTPGSFQPGYSGGFSEAWVAKIAFTGFDVCFKDDGNGDSFQFDSSTGDYRFTHGDLTVTGTGTLSQRGCLLVLEDNQSGKRVMAQFNHCNNIGHVVVQIDGAKKKTTFVVNDKNTSDSDCAP